jgi:arabinofuranosyltransferase
MAGGALRYPVAMHETLARRSARTNRHQNFEPPLSLSPTTQRYLQYAAVIALALAVTIAVLNDAWISDDALITFRYVDNLLYGHGAVFNPGERVQGYTHPLWFLLLSATTAVSHDEVWSAVVIGLFFTLLTGLAIGTGFMGAASTRSESASAAWIGLAVAAIVLALLEISDSWRSFETSGLETSLTVLLLTLLCLELAPERRRPGLVLLLGVLIALTRPDLALLAGPPCLVALWQVYRTKRWLALLSLLPLLWFVFARIYYNDFLPNTGAAKLGIFTFSQATDQGWTYLRDWAGHEPVTAAGTFVLLVVALFAAVRARSTYDTALLLGIVAYFVYVLVVGGDFMRGRFYIPFYATCLVAGGLALTRLLSTQPLERLLPIAAIVALLVLFAGPQLEPTVADPRRIPENGIVDERQYYWPGYSFAEYRKRHILINAAIGTSILDSYKRYVQACGSVTVHILNPSYIGYYVGPKMTLIDMHGLTDRYIAHLPNDQLTHRPPRPGHPEWFVPVKYLASRGDVSLLPDWQKGIQDLDCTMTKRVEPFVKDNGKIAP